MKSVCPICNKEFINKGDSKRCSIECSTIYKQTYTLDGRKIKDDYNNLLCIWCGEYKSEDKFYNRDYIHLKNRNFKSTICKVCQNNKNERVVRKAYQTIEGSLGRGLTRAKTSCVKRKINFDNSLTKKDLIEIYNKQEGKCALSGKELLPVGEANYNLNTISIDRIDSTKDYTKNNIQLVCWAINQMKNDLTNDELLDWCKLIVENSKKK